MALTAGAQLSFGVVTTGEGWGEYDYYFNGLNYSSAFLDDRIEGIAVSDLNHHSSSRPFMHAYKVDSSGNYSQYINKKVHYTRAFSGLSWGLNTAGLEVGQPGYADGRLSGFICELLIFNSILSDSDWDAVHEYYAQKYGLNAHAARPAGTYALGHSQTVSIAVRVFPDPVGLLNHDDATHRWRGIADAVWSKPRAALCNGGSRCYLR